MYGRRSQSGAGDVSRTSLGWNPTTCVSGFRMSPGLDSGDASRSNPRL